MLFLHERPRKTAGPVPPTSPVVNNRLHYHVEVDNES